jgi:hypothetical protein
MITASSFFNGALWGYHAAKADSIANREGIRTVEAGGTPALPHGQSLIMCGWIAGSTS